MINNTVSSYIASLIYPIERPDISLSCYSGTSTCSCPCCIYILVALWTLCGTFTTFKIQTLYFGGFRILRTKHRSYSRWDSLYFTLLEGCYRKKNTTFCTAFKHLFLNFFVDRFKISFQRRVFPYTPVIVDLKTQFRSRII